MTILDKTNWNPLSNTHGYYGVYKPQFEGNAHSNVELEEWVKAHYMMNTMWKLGLV